MYATAPPRPTRTFARTLPIVAASIPYLVPSVATDRRHGGRDTSGRTPDLSSGLALMRWGVLECHPAAMARTVVIVDDHDGFRALARALLQGTGYEVVGEAGDGASAIRSVRGLRPEVVLLDIQLPDMNGFDVARRVKEGPDPPAVVLISSRDALDYGRRVDRSGARGFITKAELSIGALDSVLDGTEP